MDIARQRRRHLRHRHRQVQPSGRTHGQRPHRQGAGHRDNRRQRRRNMDCDSKFGHFPIQSRNRGADIILPRSRRRRLHITGLRIDTLPEQRRSDMGRHIQRGALLLFEKGGPLHPLPQGRRFGTVEQLDRRPDRRFVRKPVDRDSRCRSRQTRPQHRSSAISGHTGSAAIFYAYTSSTKYLQANCSYVPRTGP